MVADLTEEGGEGMEGGRAGGGVKCCWWLVDDTTVLDFSNL